MANIITSLIFNLIPVVGETLGATLTIRSFSICISTRNEANIQKINLKKAVCHFSSSRCRGWFLFIIFWHVNTNHIYLAYRYHFFFAPEFLYWFHSFVFLLQMRLLNDCRRQTNSLLTIWMSALATKQNLKNQKETHRSVQQQMYAVFTICQRMKTSVCVLNLNVVLKFLLGQSVWSILLLIGFYFSFIFCNLCDTKKKKIYHATFTLMVGMCYTCCSSSSDTLSVSIHLLHIILCPFSRPLYPPQQFQILFYQSS